MKGASQRIRQAGAGFGQRRWEVVCFLTFLVSNCRLKVHVVCSYVLELSQVALVEELGEQVQDLDNDAGKGVCLLKILVKADSYNIIYYAFALSFPEY